MHNRAKYDKTIYACIIITYKSISATTTKCYSKFAEMTNSLFPLGDRDLKV